VHSPMPLGLYFGWNWGVPEATWEEIAELPDVRKAIDDELSLWRLVDRIVLPCPEALEELARVDSRFAEADVPIDYVLTGSSSVGHDGRPGPSRE
ncbi:MAG: hypothetical protein ACRD21_15720, partial [Vicinamibacteria bacterium]